MTKTPATSAAPGTYPAPPQPAATTKEQIDYLIDRIERSAQSFAHAILANPRGDQLLRLPNTHNPEQMGTDLATACWGIALTFEQRVDQYKQASVEKLIEAQTPTQEPAQ